MLENAGVFGIEIEFTGINRDEAARVLANYFESSVDIKKEYYDTHVISMPDGRCWKIMFDGSILCRENANGLVYEADEEYACELVSPILNYVEDMATLVDVVNLLREAGGLTNNSCGIHIHLDGRYHTAQSLREFINLVSDPRADFYEVISPCEERVAYCRNIDRRIVREVNSKRPVDLEELKNIWYNGRPEVSAYGNHPSRYQILNLHSFFGGNGTIELRGFNSVLDGQDVDKYVMTALKIDNMARGC